MTQTVFFSWQGDTENRVGRSLIEDALERAIKALRSDAEVDPAHRELAVDRDRKGVPGTPPLMETIFAKIDVATAFVSDLTHVAVRDDGRRMPNPNVLMEHGWALKAVTWRAMISVMNTAYGHPKEHPLPFDLQHFAHPITFDCPAGADVETKAKARDALAKSLGLALRDILRDQDLKAARRPAAPAEPHPDDLALVGRLRGLITPALRQFLEQHTFGTPFRRSILSPLAEIGDDWVGAAFEFHDPVLQAGLADLRGKARILMSLVNERIFAMDRNPEMGWAKTDMDQRHGYRKETLDGIRAMDLAATELGQALDEFTRLARDRARPPIAPAAPAVETDRAEETGRETQLRAALDGLAADRNRGGLPELVRRPSVTLRLAPHAAMAGARLDPKAVAAAQLRFPPSSDVRVETGADARQWWSAGLPKILDQLNPETAWRMRLVRPGLLEYEATIGARIDDDPDIGVDGFWLEALIVRNLERMASILTDLGLGGSAVASITLDGTDDVFLTRPRGSGRRIRQPQVILPPVPLAGLDPPLAPALQETLDMIWLSGGWQDGSPSFQGETWAGYSDAALYRLD
jgi:hypothetical protein